MLSSWRANLRRRRPEPDPLVRDLVEALGSERVRNDAAERSLFAHDASIYGGGVCGPVCFPTSTAEVQSIMRIATVHGRGVVPRGAGPNPLFCSGH